MNFLPILEREARVAARRKSTFRFRFWTAVFAVAGSFLAFTSTSKVPSPAALSNPLFQVQTFFAFLLCPLVGTFIAADSLSQEKRDGTLGLLFLTGLKAAEIVVAKLGAMLLTALYGLLALLPIIALPMLLGGLTLGDFTRMSLALANAVFVSISAGVWVSVFNRESSRAMGNTLALLLLLMVGIPAVGRLAPMTSLPNLFERLAWISPYCSFASAPESEYVLQPAKFWCTLVLSNLLGWGFLGMAIWVLPRSWERHLHRDERRKETRPLRRARGSHAPRHASSMNCPVLWLIGDAPWLRFVVWGIIVAWGILVGLSWGFSDSTLMRYRGPAFCAFLLKILVAFQTCRFFTEARQSGAMELLLCTSLGNDDLVRAQARALRRIFLGPLLAFLVISTVLALSTSALTANGAASFSQADVLGARIGISALPLFLIRLLLDTLAVTWFGMWLSLNLKHPNFAWGLTVFLVLLLPSMFGALDLVTDMIFISWGTTGLREDFRWVLIRPVDPALSSYAR